ncbi:hypothetical protein K438DRAFT_2150738, partial [Mycena galopus ATCC 62051]
GTENFENGYRSGIRVCLWSEGGRTKCRRGPEMPRRCTDEGKAEQMVVGVPISSRSGVSQARRYDRERMERGVNVGSTPRTNEVSGALSRGANARRELAAERIRSGGKSETEILATRTHADPSPECRHSPAGLGCGRALFGENVAEWNESWHCGPYWGAHKIRSKGSGPLASLPWRIRDEGERLAAAWLVGAWERGNDVEARRLEFGALTPA